MDQKRTLQEMMLQIIPVLIHHNTLRLQFEEYLIHSLTGIKIIFGNPGARLHHLALFVFTAPIAVPHICRQSLNASVINYGI